MTKKHYIEIARILKLCVRDRETLEWLEAELGNFFAKDNPKFDVILWHEAFL